MKDTTNIVSLPCIRTWLSIRVTGYLHLKEWVGVSTGNWWGNLNDIRSWPDRHPMLQYREYNGSKSICLVEGEITRFLSTAHEDHGHFATQSIFHLTFAWKDDFFRTPVHYYVWVLSLIGGIGQPERKVCIQRRKNFSVSGIPRLSNGSHVIPVS